MGLFIVDPTESVKKFDHAAKSLGGKVSERWSSQKRGRDQDSSPRRPTKKSTRRTPTPEPLDVSEDFEDDDDAAGEDEPLGGEQQDDPGAGPSSGPTQ